MKKVDTLSLEWHALRNTESELRACYYHLRKRGDFLGNILLALNTLSEQSTALRFMESDEIFNDSELIELMPTIIDIAIDGNIDNQVLAKQVLSKYRDKKIVRDIFYSVVDKYFSLSDEFVYSGLARLSTEAGFGDIFIKLMSICKNSDNPDIAEIYDHFSKFLDPNRSDVVLSKRLIR